MKKSNLYMLIGGIAIVAVGGALVLAQGGLFQGKLGPLNPCLIKFPGGTSPVTSWVSTVLPSYTPPKQGSTPVVSYIPCGKSLSKDINEKAKQPYVSPLDIRSKTGGNQVVK